MNTPKMLQINLKKNFTSLIYSNLLELEVPINK